MNRRTPSSTRHNTLFPYTTRFRSLTILCATRTSETLNATWSEFDLDSALWTIPKERMKMHVEHRVPLSNSAVELLRATAANSNRPPDAYVRSEEHTSELQSLMRISYAVFCYKKKTDHHHHA